MRILTGTFELLRDTVLGWSKNEAALRAAALAYYTIFSIAPLLFLTITIASQVVSEAAVEGRIVKVMEQHIGIQAATAVEDIIKNGFSIYSNSLAAGVGIIILLFVASTLFFQLQAAINAMWNIEPITEDVRQNIITISKARLLSAAFVLATGFLLVVSMFVTTLWSMISGLIPMDVFSAIPGLSAFLGVLSSPVVYWVLFSVVFKALPQAKIRWRDVLPGALLTAVLFWLGGFVIGQYLSLSAIASIYGAAGSIIVFLVWVYYSAWIVLFGAKFIHLYADRFGSPIVPDKGMAFKLENQSSSNNSTENK